MGNKTLVYKQKVEDNLNESYKHLLRLENAIYKLKVDLREILSAITYLIIRK